MQNPLPRSFYERPVTDVAGELIGCVLVSDVEGSRVSGRIVETEAYGMDEDAFYGRHVRPSTSGKIVTSPTGDVLLGARGVAFVYSVFFGNWLLNVVAGPPGYFGCVLLRAVEPIEGIDVMRRRRVAAGRDQRLASGPGRLTRALAVDGSLNGHALQDPPLVLYPQTEAGGARVESSRRIGVKRARNLEWRFMDASSRSLSRPPGRIAER